MTPTNTDRGAFPSIDEQYVGNHAEDLRVGDRVLTVGLGVQTVKSVTPPLHGNDGDRVQVLWESGNASSYKPTRSVTILEACE